MMAHKAVFLDRDDTIVDDPGYIRSPEQVRLIPGAGEALAQLKKMGYLLVIVTNQSGVARGFVTEKQLEEIHRELKRQLAGEDVAIDGLYYCPFHPDGAVKDFSTESNLRKPNAGMFFQAEADLDIDLAQSWMIGDSYRDIQAGSAAGCHTILVDVPGKIREKNPTDAEPDRKAVNLREAVNIIRMYAFHQKAQTAKKSPGSHQTQGPDESDESSETGLTNEVVTEEPDAIDSAGPTETQAEAAFEESPAAAPQPGPPVSTEDVPEKEPPPKKVYTAKASSQIQTPEPSDSGGDTRHLLEEIVHRLKHNDREKLYQEFSVFKLLSMMLQVFAVVALVASLAVWLSRDGKTESVLIMIGYSIALQLTVIALLLMHSKD